MQDDYANRHRWAKQSYGTPLLNIPVYTMVADLPKMEHCSCPPLALGSAKSCGIGDDFLVFLVCAAYCAIGIVPSWISGDGTWALLWISGGFFLGLLAGVSEAFS